jgi:GNAT superfamily N-acetyltransferase
LQPLPLNLMSPIASSTLAELILYPAAGSSFFQNAAARAPSGTSIGAVMSVVLTAIRPSMVPSGSGKPCGSEPRALFPFGAGRMPVLLPPLPPLPLPFAPPLAPGAPDAPGAPGEPAAPADGGGFDGATDTPSWREGDAAAVGDVGPEADGSPPPPQPARASTPAASTGTSTAIRGVIVRVLMCRKPHYYVERAARRSSPKVGGRGYPDPVAPADRRRMGAGRATRAAGQTGRMGLPATTSLPDGRRVVLRAAGRGDIAALVTLLTEDELGSGRDGIENAADLVAYERAFQAIDRDRAHVLLAAESDSGVVGTLQLSFLPGLARRGGWRAQIESVRVAAALRGQGLGSLMIRWAVDEAAERGCTLVQLTSDKQRADAHRFYERLGFQATHEGMKLDLR